MTKLGFAMGQPGKKQNDGNDVRFLSQTNNILQ
jgi:hypothetical protein